jgi:hypothetical protein
MPIPRAERLLMLDWVRLFCRKVYDTVSCGSAEVADAYNPEEHSKTTAWRTNLAVVAKPSGPENVRDSRSVRNPAVLARRVQHGISWDATDPSVVVHKVRALTRLAVFGGAGKCTESCRCLYWPESRPSRQSLTEDGLILKGCHTNVLQILLRSHYPNRTRSTEVASLREPRIRVVWVTEVLGRRWRLDDPVRPNIPPRELMSIHFQFRPGEACLGFTRDSRGVVNKS